MNSAFINKNRAELVALHSHYKTVLDGLLIPFWEARVQDREQGGYFNCFDQNGTLYDTKKPGWFIGRTLYTFSSLYSHYQKNPQWLQLAAGGRSFLEKAALPQGRFAQMLDRDGTPTAGATSIFTDHFAVKGLYAYIEAAGAKEEIPYAKALTEKLFAHVKEPDILATEGIPHNLQKHAICFMTLLVALEGRGLFKDLYRPILEDCIHRSLYQFANDRLQVPFEYVDKDGLPVPTGEGRLVDPGHSMEALWFCMRAGEELGQPRYIQRAVQVLDWVLRLGWDSEYGGFYQHVDYETHTPQARFLVNNYAGTPVPFDAKIWWVQAEGLYTLLYSALLSGNQRHLQYFLELHGFCEQCFLDRAVGEWNSITNRDGSLLDGRKGFELKGPYHVVRAHQQIVAVLQRALDTE